MDDFLDVQDTLADWIISLSFLLTSILIFFGIFRLIHIVYPDKVVWVGSAFLGMLSLTSFVAFLVTFPSKKR